MNLLTPEQYNEVERLAGLFFSEAEILIIMGLDENLFSNENIKIDFNSAYQRGTLKSKAEIRTGIFNLAKNGSSPAQILAQQIIDSASVNNVNI